MPIPESETANSITQESSALRSSLTSSLTKPWSVNLTAFRGGLLRIWRAGAGRLRGLRQGLVEDAIEVQILFAGLHGDQGRTLFITVS
jgi:hypothetical protein